MGVMFRRAWPPEYDLLLFNRCRAVHTFFTFIPLDIVFLDARDRVKGIVRGTAPWRFYIGPRGTAHVAEMPGGGAARRGLKAGGRVRFAG